ncbi:MAG: hypothetical protein HS103_06415 [Anaerolineales bacterium]|nr:hypothetical protein [Anaerolineales bacterium]
MQTRWSMNELVEMVEAVFQRVERQDDHHLGSNRYLTPYQIVLGLAELFPVEVT